MDYLLLKYIHIISSTILFGTGIGSAFFMFTANRRKDVAEIYIATRHVVIADWVFTAPSVVVQLITGIALAESAGYTLSEGWVFQALVLYTFAGLCWLPVVWLQIRMRDMARKALDDGADLPGYYWNMNRWWIALGSLAFPAVIIIFYLMVYKTGL